MGLTNGKKRLFISILMTILVVFSLNKFYINENLIINLNNEDGRIDIFNIGSAQNNMNVVSQTSKLNITCPEWMKNPKWKNNGGQGCSITSKIKNYYTDNSIILKAVGSGTLEIGFRGPWSLIDKNDRNKGLNQIYVIYKDIYINDKKVLESKKTWHNDAFIYKQAVADGEIVKISYSNKKYLNFSYILSSINFLYLIII